MSKPATSERERAKGCAARTRLAAYNDAPRHIGAPPTDRAAGDKGCSRGCCWGEWGECEGKSEGAGFLESQEQCR